MYEWQILHAVRKSVQICIFLGPTQFLGKNKFLIVQNPKIKKPYYKRYFHISSAARLSFTDSWTFKDPLLCAPWSLRVCLCRNTFVYFKSSLKFIVIASVRLNYTIDYLKCKIKNFWLKTEVWQKCVTFPNENKQ